MVFELTNITEDITKDVVEDIVKDIAEDITKDIVKDIMEDITKDIVKDITEDITKDIVKDITEDIIENVIKNTTKDIIVDNIKNIAKNITVNFMHDNENKKKDIITYVTISLTNDEDKHNFRKHDICSYGTDLNITIKKHFSPEISTQLAKPVVLSDTYKFTPSNIDNYGYIIHDGTIEYNEDIIKLIKKNLENRILFS